MRPHISKTLGFLILILFCIAPAAAQSQKKQKNLKPLPDRVWTYEGGIFLIGDGALPNGPCFRIHGRVTSGNFFDNLNRIDTENGTIFRSSKEDVTHFPDEVHLSFSVYDQLCPSALHTVGTREYLTREMMSTLHLNLYWKHGVDMRPAGKIKLINFAVEPIPPYATDLAAELPERFLWTYELAIPSAGVPLGDSLVLIFRAPNGRIAARVAARL